MAKRREDLENRILTPVITLRRPSIENETKHIVGTRCQTCRDRIDTFMDDYIIIDDMMFCSDRHVTDYFISEAGGRRVPGGAC